MVSGLAEIPHFKTLVDLNQELLSLSAFLNLHNCNLPITFYGYVCDYITNWSLYIFNMLLTIMGCHLLRAEMINPERTLHKQELYFKCFTVSFR